MEYPLKIQNALELLSIFVVLNIRCFINSDSLSLLATKLGKSMENTRLTPRQGSLYKHKIEYALLSARKVQKGSIIRTTHIRA